MSIQVSGMGRVLVSLNKNSQIYKDGKAEALRRTGAYSRKELVRYLRATDRPLHKVTKFMKGRRGRFGFGSKNKRTIRVAAVRHKSHYFLKQLARYRSDERKLHIDFGGSRRGEPGRLDNRISGWIVRIQEGKTYKVTPKMRRYFAAIGIPIKKGLSMITTKPRNIMPAFKTKHVPKMIKRYDNRFNQIIRREVKKRAV